MANKLTRWCGKLAPVLFTSIVAPLVVNLAIRTTPETPSSPAVPSFTFSTVTQPSQTIRVIVSGVGRTREAALQDAVHTALRQALASLVDTEIWAKNDSTLCAGLLHDKSGILLGWKDLGVRKERGRQGLFYHEEAAVEVNLTALANRLHVRHTACCNNSTQVAPMQCPLLFR